MKNALHFINRDTAIRLFAAFFCFALFIHGQIIAAPGGDVQNVQINSLQIHASNTPMDDSVFLVVDATLTSSGCGIENYDVVILSDNQIEVNAYFWQGDALAICNTSDTLFLGKLEPGEYNLVFNQLDSLSFKINYSADSCAHKGTVYDYTGLDGCGYVIVLDNGTRLEPVEIIPNIELRDTMRVKLSYIPVDMASICMVGQTAIITCLQEIDAEPCMANFKISTYEPSSIPYTYHFENNSTGDDLHYEWDFGDSITSTEISPVHTFADTGIYFVCLRVYNESGCEDEICKRINVGVVYPACKAQFTYQYIPCDSLQFDYCPGYPVQFNDESYGDDLLYKWDLGDGNISYEQNPLYFYENAGFYTVTLKIESATDFRYCADEITKQIRVGVPDSSCNAYFKYKAKSAHQYEFHALLSNSNMDTATVNWDFGDGTSGTGRIIDHIYAEAGIYKACVTVVTVDGCTSTYCETIIIDEPGDCLSTFDYTFLPCECLNCACLHFTSNTTDDVVEWLWDFGDGTYSHEADPYHTYYTLENKKYTVCLTTMASDSCKSIYCKNISVNGGGYDVPWEPVISGDENHIIIIPENINAPELENGDYLGLFFKDPNGNDVCGGMLEWKSKAGTLTAWGVGGDTSELTLVIKNGFLPGETFGYKIWKHSTNQIIEIGSAKYEVDSIITDSSAYRNDGLSKLIELKSCDSQGIYLYQGWNLISLNVVPADKEMKHIFGNNQNILVKDASGEIKYFPYGGIEDGEWNILEGYKIKVWENTGIKVCGSSIDMQTSIPLNGAMYPTFLPYFYQFEYPIEYALYEIKDDIQYVQSLEYLDGTGKVMALNYIPAYGINQIGNMKPGLAYRLSLLTTIKSFAYPYPFIKDGPYPISWNSINRNTTTNRLKAAFENSDKNRIMVIPESVLTLNAGNEINIYTPDGFFAGSWLYNGEGNTAVTLWDNPEIPDYTEFEISVVDSSRNEVARYSVNIEEDVNIDGAILELKKATATSSYNIMTENTIDVYPNPASDVIRFELPGEDISPDVSIKVFDLSGRIVFEQNNGLEGKLFEVSIDDLNNGIYVLQIQSMNNVYKTKFAKGN